MNRTVPSPLRAVVIDSRPERRAVMSYLVDGNGVSTSVVGEAGSCDAARAVVDAQRADVAIVEVHMPPEMALDTIRELHRSFPRLGVVACGFDVDNATELDVLEAGAQACLPKPVARRVLQAAIEAAYLSAADRDIPLTAAVQTGN